MPQRSIQDLKQNNELITSLITLKMVLKILKLEIKNKLRELEQEKIDELKLL